MASTPAEPARGREAVEAALIDATCDLLAEFGPRATSVRDIAKRAGVNHAQVHHYFGGKRGLLMAAMRTLASDHHDAVVALTDGSLPPPMAAPGDQRYWIAVVRATIEGDLELAGLEVADGVSVARGALEHLTSKAGLEEPSVELKGELAYGIALQLGWLAFEKLAYIQAAVSEDEQDAVRDIVIERARRGYANPSS